MLLSDRDVPRCRPRASARMPRTASSPRV